MVTRPCARAVCDLPNLRLRSRWCSERCYHADYQARPVVRRRYAKVRRKRRNEVRGRVCHWCDRDDAQTSWSGSDTACRRCSGQRHKRARCERCDGPTFAYRVRGNPAGCVRRAHLPFGVDCARG